MEIFEKEVVLIFLDDKFNDHSENVEYVVDIKDGKLLITWFYYIRNTLEVVGFKRDSYRSDLFQRRIKIISHPCPINIRHKIIAMLNSGDSDNILLAEAILKNL